MMRDALLARPRTHRQRAGAELGVAGLLAFAGILLRAHGEPPPQAQQRSVLTVQPVAATTRWTPTHGERELVFRLHEGSGVPVTTAAADLHIYAAAGVELAPLAAAGSGTYRTHLRWPAGLAELALRVEARNVRSAAVIIELEPTALEPPPAVAPLPAVAPPPAASRPALPGSRLAAAPRVGFELGLAGAALVNQGVYGFGGDVDLGARFRLPFGALAVLLRAGLEQHIQPEPAPLLLNLGVHVTYRIGRPQWRLSPYFGLWLQGILQRRPDALGAIPLQRSESGLLLGGLAGAQLRLWHGGLFTELGYRGPLYRQTAAAVPAWSSVFLLLGYRFSTN